MEPESRFDVVVVGAGNAALCAALAAAEGGAHVAVLEKAPEHLRGGNSYFSGGLFRFAHEGVDDIAALLDEPAEELRKSIEARPYPVAEMYADLMRVTEGLSDPDLAQVLTSRSYETVCWMKERGVRWVPAYGRQAFPRDGVHRFWGGIVLEAVGAGKGLSDSLFELCEKAGVEVRYDAAARSLELDRTGAVEGVHVRTPEGSLDIAGRSIVLACGGFEANPEMRARYLGAGWELAKVRGTRYNTGEGIDMALAAGAMSHGHWSGCHAVAWDLNAPPFGDRVIADLFQKHSYPFGIIVNVDGERFVDEGADLRNYTYAKYGREVLFQPRRAAFQIFDRKTRHLLRDEYRITEVSSAEADSIGELADRLGIDRPGLESTVSEFNASTNDGEFDPASLDGLSTSGVTPPKSNWALPLDEPPFVGYAVTCGITFTFGGLKITSGAEVLDTRDVKIPGLYAAGELVGGLFYYNYPGGAGLTAGSVFGRIAGRGAADYAGRT